jgi:hypothetical protein
MYLAGDSSPVQPHAQPNGQVRNDSVVLVLVEKGNRKVRNRALCGFPFRHFQICLSFRTHVGRKVCRQVGEESPEFKHELPGKL